MYDGFDVDVDECEVLSEVDVSERAADADAGVEHCDVERPTQVDDVLPKFLDGVVVGEVSTDGVGVDAEVSEFLADLDGAATAAGHDKVVAAAGQLAAISRTIPMEAPVIIASGRADG